VRVLDVGAGDGYVAVRLLAALPEGSSVTCVDSNYTPEQLATLAKVTPEEVTFTTRVDEGARFDWLVLLDVLEHVTDDAGFLSRLVATHLAPGGSVLVSVPAWPGLFTRHDVVLGHLRRYRPSELSDVFDRAGLTRVEGGSLFSSLIPVRAASKALEMLVGVRSAPASGEAAAHVETGVSGFHGDLAVAGLAEWLLAGDTRLGAALAARGISLPGLSIWARGRLR